MIIQMHSTLLTLEDSNLHPSMFEDLYEVECLKDPNSVQRNVPKQSNKRPIHASSVSDIKQIK
jgi:hypothetical protein